MERLCNHKDKTPGCDHCGKLNESSEPKKNIHAWFSLTYGSYFVCQRSILQSMPAEWQDRFVKCLEELDTAADGLPGLKSDFWVRAREGNRFVKDKYQDYERGRRNVFAEVKACGI